MSISVLLVDDHGLVRAGIRSLLAAAADVHVLGEASDGENALRLTASLHPDIVLLDLSMAGMSGLQALKRLRAEHPATRVIVLSMHADDAYVTQALRSGANGYLIKDAAPVDLETALRKVAAGETFLSPGIARRGASCVPADAPLTPRQKQVLKLMAEGHSTKEIAFALELSVKTVETYRAQLMERLQIRDVPGLTRYAIRIGLVST